MHPLQRLWHQWLTGLSARTPVALLVFVFATSWIAMILVRTESDIADVRNYWWWFLVTTSTVGYGELFPQTVPGRVVGVYVILGGIVTLSTAFTHLANAVSATKGRRMQGTAPLDLTGHLVLLGYHPGRTDRLVADLLADAELNGRDLRIALCAWEDQAEHDPLPQDLRTGFVRGDLSDLDVLARAAIDRADVILVDPRNDDEAVTLAVAAEEAAPGLHAVVALRDLARRRTIHRVDPSSHCVQWHATRLIFEELQDPGIAAVYDQLMMPGGTSTWSSPVPAGAGSSYGAWQQALGETYGATLLGVRSGESLAVSPDWATPVPDGARLYYVGERRLTAKDLAAARGD